MRAAPSLLFALTLLSGACASRIDGCRNEYDACIQGALDGSRLQLCLEELRRCEDEAGEQRLVSPSAPPR